MAVREGDFAPGFAERSDGKDCFFPLLASCLGNKHVVLYFYPKDDTPGCTKEAESFRDLANDFSRIDTVVVGVSKDSAASHESFKKKYNLDFELISDEDAKLAQSYGVWVEKGMFGKTYMGIERATFLIDKRGSVRKVWRNVKVNGHSSDVLKAALEIRDFD
ncbi:MAG: peroxiredoxin [Aaplasma endosymbiont of Hyalomma asiaticum]